jgi:hemerythrin-like domain-containing protein
MPTIQALLTRDHRLCDGSLIEAEHAVLQQEWGRASAAFAQFQQLVLQHFEAEESLLFPAFEAMTALRAGPTQVMRNEHLQLRDLMAAARHAVDQRDADAFAGEAETLLIMLQQHNVKEENVLYPLCDQQLVAQRGALITQLAEKIAHQRD